MLWLITTTANDSRNITTRRETTSTNHSGLPWLLYFCLLSHLLSCSFLRFLLQLLILVQVRLWIRDLTSSFSRSSRKRYVPGSFILALCERQTWRSFMIPKSRYHLHFEDLFSPLRRFCNWKLLVTWRQLSRFPVKTTLVHTRAALFTCWKNSYSSTIYNLELSILTLNLRWQFTEHRKIQLAGNSKEPEKRSKLLCCFINISFQFQFPSFLSLFNSQVSLNASPKLIH